MIAVAALAVASCSKSDDVYDESRNRVTDAYNAAFLRYVGGSIDSNQDWGFGQGVTRSAGFTRGNMPATPNFRDTNPIVKPEVPAAYQNTVPSTAKYAKDYQNYQKGDVIYINTEYQTLNNPQNTENLTIYVDGEVTYSGQTNQGGNGTVFCVTNNSTLHLGAVSNNLIVYLAPGAVLDLTKSYTEDWSTGSKQIIENSTPSFSFQNSKAAIYVSSGSKVKAYNLTLISGAKLLNDGGTIEANNLTLDQNATLWNEGSIKVANTLTLTNTSSALYNKEDKTIETVNLDLINNDALLFNEGTVKATGNIVLHNTNAEIINYGSLSGASFSAAAGGKMHNEGTGNVNITGKTDLTNSNSSWMNDGQWTCGSFDIDNYSHVNINNCRLTVNGQFHLNRGTFALGAESGVVCNSFAWEDTSDFYLGSNSVLKVLGDLVTNNANSGYGFRGIGTDYAVIEATRITHNGNEQFRMSYYGKLLVATQNHFDQWYKDAPNTNQPAYWYEGTVKFTKDGDNIATIPETDCNPGYEGEDIIVSGNDIRIMVEDLSAAEDGDFDFNDVVFDVKFTSETTADVTLIAAGGTLPLTVAGQEVHAKFGNYSTNTMINTNAAAVAAKANAAAGKNLYAAVDNVAPVTFQVSGINRANNGNDIVVKVQKGGEWYTIEAKKGMPAAKFGCDPKVNYVNEQISFKAVYDKFTGWVQNKNVQWY